MTSQQLREYEARMYGNGRHCDHNKPVEDESDLHNAIIDYCKSKGWQYLHGSMAHRSRRTLGENDFTILADRSQVRFVECKSKNGKLSPDQQAFIAHAKKNGHVVYVVRSLDEFVKLFA
jgi:hypothetical protein